MSVVYSISEDVNIIDLNVLFTERTYIEILNDLYKFGILNGVITQDVKRIIYHHVIYDVCQAYLNSPLKKTVVLFTPNQIDDCALFSYFKEEDIIGILLHIFNKIQKYLPIRCYLSKFSGNYIKYNATSNHGRVLNAINCIRDISISSVKTENTFEGIKKFTKKYGLTYLNQDYFSKIAAKHLYIR